MRLKDKTILITGAASGFGRAMSIRFAEEGASLVLVDLNPDGLQETVDLAKSKNPEIQVLTSTTNISKEDQVINLVEDTYDKFELLNILVNNAGIQGPLEELINISLEDFKNALDVNLCGTFLMCKHFSKRMLKQRKLKPLRGKIINISSAAGKEALNMIGAYSISKFGIIGLTQVLAKELAPKITVNALCPGMHKTQMYREDENLMKQAKGLFKAQIWMKRWGTADDVANVAFFLASDDSNYMTGQSINITGGWIFH
ncbi:MAG: glucose 1-dehydrogenase [Candidatus Lokiarchaeota archaeon]|nr:glucose 1-dehydrogenase [Candidatus Lokiarchaeota archaeon]